MRHDFTVNVLYLCVCIKLMFFFDYLTIQVPVTLLDTSALRSRAQLGKKRAPRSRPSRAALQTSEQTEDWTYRDSTGKH